jgi:streptogramin lyase
MRSPRQMPTPKLLSLHELRVHSSTRNESGLRVPYPFARSRSYRALHLFGVALVLALLSFGRGEASSRFTTFPYGRGGATLSDIVTGNDGNLWFTDSTNDAIVRITTEGKMTVFPLVPHNGTLSFVPQQLTVGSDGDFYVGGCLRRTPQSCDYVGLVTTSGLLSLLPTPHNEAPGWLNGALALGSDGNVWFPTEQGYGKITPAGVVTAYTDGLSPEAGIAASPGKIWVTGTQPSTFNIPVLLNVNVKTGGVISTATGCNFWRYNELLTVVSASTGIYTVCETDYDNESFHLIQLTRRGTGAVFFANDAGVPNTPRALAATADGRIWAISTALTSFDPDRDAIVAYLPPISTSGGAITTGPDGNIWFLNSGSAPSVTKFRVGGLQLSVKKSAEFEHRWTQFPSQIPVSDYPGGIVEGADRALWYTDSKAGTLLRMTTSGVVSQQSLVFGSPTILPWADHAWRGPQALFRRLLRKRHELHR